jgi:ABC-type Fe3+ transport system permease subunit
MGTRTVRWPLVVWCAGLGLIALALLVTLFGATVTSTVLVDELPGGSWTPETTTVAVDAAHATMAWSFGALVGVVVIGVAVPLIVRFRRRASR